MSQADSKEESFDSLLARFHVKEADRQDFCFIANNPDTFPGFENGVRNALKSYSVKDKVLLMAYFNNIKRNGTYQECLERKKDKENEQRHLELAEKLRQDKAKADKNKKKKAKAKAKKAGGAVQASEEQDGQENSAASTETVNEQA